MRFHHHRVSRGDVRAGKRLAIGQRGINAGVHPGAFAHDLGEEPELAHGAPALAGESVERQARLEMGALEQAVADGEDFLGDALEEHSALFRADLAASGERFLGEGERVMDILGRALVKGGLEFTAVERADRAKTARTGCGGDAIDEAFSVKGHGKLIDDRDAVRVPDN